MPRLLPLALLIATPAFAQLSPSLPATTTPIPVQTPGIAPAAPNPFLHDETKADAEAKADAMFRRMDNDHDGFVTAGEIAAFFAAASKTSDGKLPPSQMGRAKAMLDDADTDKDGKISPEESKAAADQGFDEVDTNHDGIVSPEEKMAAIHGASGPPKPQDESR